jgi:lipopolysaccharide/colanic/teichoic acid biosynthesis glycosyltransferase
MYALNSRERLAPQAQAALSVSATATAKLEPVRIELAEPSDIAVGGSLGFWAAKRVFDIAVGVLLLPVLALFALSLFACNPLLNRGPLFYSQIRMGRGGKSFRILKFRTMLPAPQGATIAFASAETDRITRLGALLRKFRIDELPQIGNVLIGNMSFVGPRPEQVAFAQNFSKTIPGYHYRHVVRPGISGLAQVTNGYADCGESTRQKLARDLEYIRDAGWKMEIWIVMRTFYVVFTGYGAR